MWPVKPSVVINLYETAFDQPDSVRGDHRPAWSYEEDTAKSTISDSDVAQENALVKLNTYFDGKRVRNLEDLGAIELSSEESTLLDEEATTEGRVANFWRLLDGSFQTVGGRPGWIKGQEHELVSDILQQTWCERYARLKWGYFKLHEKDGETDGIDVWFRMPKTVLDLQFSEDRWLFLVRVPHIKFTDFTELIMAKAQE